MATYTAGMGGDNDVSSDDDDDDDNDDYDSDYKQCMLIRGERKLAATLQHGRFWSRWTCPLKNPECARGYDISEN